MIRSRFTGARMARMIAAGTVAAVAYGVLAVAGLNAAVSPDASGSPNCLASGSTCMRDANNSNVDGNPIVEGSNINGPAENMVWDGAAQVYRFTGHPGKCLGLNAADTQAVLQPCNGGHGIIQIKQLVNGAWKILNNAATQHFGTSEWITAVNVNGAQIGPAASGGFMRWTK